MKIRWLGHAAFIITAENGTSILTDPYEPGGFSGAIGYGPITEKADIVTVSHSHSDHSRIPAALGREAEVIRDKVNKNIKGIVISTVDSFHDTSAGKERGTNTIFIFEVDGIRVAHFGDLGHPLDDKKIKELGRIDVALIPVGGAFTIDSRAATDIINKLKPKLVIPMHFKTSKVGFDIDSVELFLKDKAGVEKSGSSEIEITAATLSSAATRVVVLKHAH
jgi:L-ascorbate metabolism protein UlaG (beta-lactamase superfamily)